MLSTPPVVVPSEPDWQHIVRELMEEVDRRGDEILRLSGRGEPHVESPSGDCAGRVSDEYEPMPPKRTFPMRVTMAPSATVPSELAALVEEYRRAIIAREWATDDERPDVYGPRLNAAKSVLDASLSSLADRAARMERERDEYQATVRDYQARMIAVGTLICTPVSEKNLRDAKEMLTPAYHDAAREIIAARQAASTSTTGGRLDVEGSGL